MEVNNAATIPPVQAPPPVVPNQTPPAAPPATATAEQTQTVTSSGYDIREIEGLDLNATRNANLDPRAEMLLIIPVIGWIVFACMVWHAKKNHKAAEEILKTAKFDEATTPRDEKIKALSNAILKKGSQGWKYKAERARQHLLAGQFKEAQEDFVAFNKARGMCHVQWYGGDYLHPYHNLAENVLAAAVYVSNKKFTLALSAYKITNYHSETYRNVLAPKHIRFIENEIRANPSILLNTNVFA